MSMFIFPRHVKNQSSLWGSFYKIKKKGRVKGNKEVYVKLKKLILVGSKWEENSSRFEPGKFAILRCKQVLKLEYYIKDLTIHRHSKVTTICDKGMGEMCRA